MGLKRGWTTQRENEQKSCRTSFGHTKLHLVGPLRRTHQGAKAVIPLETGFRTLRTSSFTPSSNDGLLEKSLDLIEERRENVIVQLAYNQHKLKQGYDANVRLRSLAPKDLVLRKVLGTAKNPVREKLGPNQEGSYCITSVAGIGAYYLEDLEEKAVPRQWNVNNLRICYY